MECIPEKTMTDTLNLYEMFSTDESSEENGTWLNLTDTTGFKIRFAGAKAVLDLREKLMKPYATLIRVGGEIPDEKAEEIGRRVVGGSIICDWKGVKLPSQTDDAKVLEALAELPADKAAVDVDGCVPYSPEAAYALLKIIPRMLGVISAYASDSQNYKNAARDEGVKN